jgi:hypothetical protein
MPSVRNARQGWQTLAAAWATDPTDRPEVGIGMRLGLVFLLLQTLLGGLWITLSPATFFNALPGFGRAWVSVDGPYNEHLLRDFGALNLALGVVLVFAVGASAAATRDGRQPPRPCWRTATLCVSRISRGSSGDRR